MFFFFFLIIEFDPTAELVITVGISFRKPKAEIEFH